MLTAPLRQPTHTHTEILFWFVQNNETKVVCSNNLMVFEMFKFKSESQAATDQLTNTICSFFNNSLILYSSCCQNTVCSTILLNNTSSFFCEWKYTLQSDVVSLLPVCIFSVGKTIYFHSTFYTQWKFKVLYNNEQKTLRHWNEVINKYQTAKSKQWQKFTQRQQWKERFTVLIWTLLKIIGEVVPSMCIMVKNTLVKSLYSYFRLMFPNRQYLILVVSKPLLRKGFYIKTSCNLTRLKEPSTTTSHSWISQCIFDQNKQ